MNKKNGAAAVWIRTGATTSQKKGEKAMKFLTVQDLMQLLGRSESYCYKVIRQLNQELKEKGYLVNPGRIPEQYFYERCYYGPADKKGA